MHIIRTVPPRSTKEAIVDLDSAIVRNLLNLIQQAMPSSGTI